MELKSSSIIPESEDSHHADWLGQVKKDSRITILGYWWSGAMYELQICFDVRPELNYPEDNPLLVIGALPKRFTKRRNIFGLVLSLTDVDNNIFTRVGVFRCLFGEFLVDRLISNEGPVVAQCWSQYANIPYRGDIAI